MKKPIRRLPDSIKPMLAQAADGPFDSSDHLFEIKWDGTRCLAFIEKDRLRLQNRRNIEMRDRYPELACLRRLPAGTVLDGEIVILEEGKPSFNKLQQREHLLNPARITALSKRIPATLIAFDVLYEAWKNVTAVPLSERRLRLIELVKSLGDPHVIVPDHIVEHGCAYFAGAKKLALEGIMAKRLDSPYLVGKRSRHWLKIKVAETAEFELVGYVPREGDAAVSALVIAKRERGKLVCKGKVGSGFTEQDRREFFRQLSKLPGLDERAVGGPAEAVWKRTGLRCAVRYFEATKSGMLRAPVFKGLIGPS